VRGRCLTSTAVLARLALTEPGGGSTVSNKAATDEPYTLLAAIEYVYAGLALVGVPDTMPVTGSSVRPAGSGEKTVKLSACPLSVGTNGVNAAPTVAVTGLV
jgi:hypothetical protein